MQLTAASALAGPAGRRAWGAAGAESLYASAIVIDGLGSPGSLETESGEPLTAVEVSDVAKSGLTALNVTVGAVGSMPPLAAFESAARGISRWEREIDGHPDVLSRVRSVADVEAAKAAGRTGLAYGLQDGVCFEDDLNRLEILHGLGIRVVQPTYNRRNLLGDGCMEPGNAGLSLAGREAIERMNALGIMVDMSHCGRQTAADAFAVSTKPVSFTHTGCFALASTPGTAQTKKSAGRPTAAE